jgi:prepilin-type N-terminal cleavage/methylation domain-containing protein
MKHTSHTGFSLIELSIVLVIIGLLTGGILVGRSLINLAQIRAQISQIEKFDTAVKTFQLKYNCLPGDCSQAVIFGLGSSGGPGDNGNGNAHIEGFPLNKVYGPEIENFWYHLSMGKVIGGGFPGYTGTLPIPGKETPALL